MRIRNTDHNVSITGVVAYDLVGILKILKQEKWLTSEEYNNRLRQKEDN
jgi:hypothetical protein